MKRLAIDWTRCDGHALCARLLPEAIGMDEWGFPVPDDRALEGKELAGARRAVLACPSLALRVARVRADQHDRSEGVEEGGIVAG